jgi:hypothetical protein
MGIDIRARCLSDWRFLVVLGPGGGTDGHMCTFIHK